MVTAEDKMRRPRTLFKVDFGLLPVKIHYFVYMGGKNISLKVLSNLFSITCLTSKI